MGMKKSELVSRSLIYAVCLGVSIFIALAAREYAGTFPGAPIPDLILDHIPYINNDFFFYQGAIMLVGLMLFVVIRVPQYIPFTLASAALFYLIRSGFMVTTHLPATSAISKQDLFFSGHTGLPFLFALIFWRYKALRYILIIASGLAGASVLFAHQHYTIDVLGAYFITYTIYQIAKKVFKKDYESI